MAELPGDAIERAEQLTRRARETADEAAAEEALDERADVLAEHRYRARVRDEGDRAVLICYPDEWVEDGTVRPERVEDTEDAVEVPLSGPTDADWEEVAAANAAVVDAIEEAHGEVHAANARALADFAENHHATTIDRLTDAQLDRFREEYYPRNAWPTDEQAAALEDSLELVLRKCESASDAPPE